MSKSLLLMICILTGLLVLACAKSTTNRNTYVSTGEPIGIPECDNFITAYENCVASKVPEASREHLRTAMETWRTQWKKLADNPQTRGSLAAHCKLQRETTMTQMKAQGCTW